MCSQQQVGKNRNNDWGNCCICFSIATASCCDFKLKHFPKTVLMGKIEFLRSIYVIFKEYLLYLKIIFVHLCWIWNNHFQTYRNIRSVILLLQVQSLKNRNTKPAVIEKIAIILFFVCDKWNAILLINYQRMYDTPFLKRIKYGNMD